MKFLSTQIGNSVIFQIFLAMLLIAGMALASMGLSVYTTIHTQNDAEAINLAGSLRMQSYRIAHVLDLASAVKITNPQETILGEMNLFSEKLYQSTIFESIKTSGNAPLDKSYDKVVANWRKHAEPILQSAATKQPSLSWEQARIEYEQHLSSHVSDIETMVTNLQRNTEGKIELLGMTEGTSIFLIIFILIFFIMKADSNLVVPLRGLVQAAEKVKAGDLNQRTTYAGDNELGLLSQTFNDMTESLQEQYRTLEDQVRVRTEELHKSNQALYFLYKTSREITSSPYDQQLLNVFLSDLKKLVEVEMINLCVNPDPNYSDYQLITTDSEGKSLCFGDCDECDLTPQNLQDAPTGKLSLPLKNREDVFGHMHIRTPNGAPLESWRYQLLKTVAENLSTAFAFHHTLGQERRVILHEERSTIARELHDSLAQSLSYMKLETARLKKMIDRDFEREKIDNAITDLQEGLNAAYKHLRELLVTFRLKLDVPNLRIALEQTVQEMRAQTSANVTLDYALGAYIMSANEDIHTLHILREALNNAIKHANADNIIMRCSRSDRGEAVFVIEDDGVGMPDNPEKQHHYGIYTMQERAQRLDGTLTYARLPAGGTRVQLTLKPAQQILQA
jgi:two-component system nitrate/nitrite sensor histidine kinase NarX